MKQNVINEIYLKYLPAVKKLGGAFDIDFPDTTLILNEEARTKKSLEIAIKNAIKRNHGDKITITVRPGKITVSDQGEILSKKECELLSSEFVKVKSRIGFGTTVTILD